MDTIIAENRRMVHASTHQIHPLFQIMSVDIITKSDPSNVCYSIGSR